MSLVRSVPVELEDGCESMTFVSSEGESYCILNQVFTALKIPDSTWKGWPKPMQVVERNLALIRQLR
jgi:hypothetical protein